MSKESSNQQYLTVQCLRGIAAVMVVIFHCQLMWAQRLAHIPKDALWGNLASGVDLFFVISGFVMIVSSPKLIARTDGWRVFFWRRLIRIAPLYWLITCLRLALLWAVPSFAINQFPDVVNILSSFLFLPSYDPLHQPVPVLGDGWTLSYEMLFYVIFAAGMWFRAPLLPFLCSCFGILSVVALYRTDNWPVITVFAQLVILEFLFGAIIGRVILRGSQITAIWSIALMLMGFVLLLTMPGSGDTIGAAKVVSPCTLRFLVRGIPASMIVYAACAGEIHLRPHLPRILRHIGDASYSIYLTHSFVLAALGVLLGKLHLHSLPLLLACAILVGIPASVMVGSMVYRFVENPMLIMMRNLPALQMWSRTRTPL